MNYVMMTMKLAGGFRGFKIGLVFLKTTRDNNTQEVLVNVILYQDVIDLRTRIFIDSRREQDFQIPELLGTPAL